MFSPSIRGFLLTQVTTLCRKICILRPLYGPSLVNKFYLYGRVACNTPCRSSVRKRYTSLYSYCNERPLHVWIPCRCHLFGIRQESLIKPQSQLHMGKLPCLGHFLCNFRRWFFLTPLFHLSSCIQWFLSVRPLVCIKHLGRQPKHCFLFG